jgi:hypothetical protein
MASAAYAVQKSVQKCPRHPRNLDATLAINVRLMSAAAVRPRDYQGTDSIGFDTDALIEVPRIENAIGNAAAQSSAMTQNARGPSAP